MGVTEITGVNQIFVNCLFLFYHSPHGPPIIPLPPITQNVLGGLIGLIAIEKYNTVLIVNTLGW